jgi:hypothetical protein
MDILFVIVIVAMVLLVMIILAALHVQQTGQLRDIQARLNMIDDTSSKEIKDPNSLRFDRTQLIDPLSLLEPLLHSENRESLTEEELQLISSAREGVKAISEQLKASNDWKGAPFDLEWFEYLDRLPRIKSLYLRADLQPILPKPPTSDS